MFRKLCVRAWRLCCRPCETGPETTDLVADYRLDRIEGGGEEGVVVVVVGGVVVVESVIDSTKTDYDYDY